MTLSDEDLSTLIARGWRVTSHVGDGYTVIAKGNLEEAPLIGSATVRIMAVDDAGFERSGGVTIYANDIVGQTPEIIASTGGWRGHAESTVGLRANAAVLAYAAELIEVWREREDRLARIAAVFPAAAAEARLAGQKTITITIPLVQAINDLGVIEDLIGDHEEFGEMIGASDSGTKIPSIEALRAAIEKAS